MEVVGDEILEILDGQEPLQGDRDSGFLEKSDDIGQKLLSVEGMYCLKSKVGELGVKILAGRMGKILSRQYPVDQVSQVVDVGLGNDFILADEFRGQPGSRTAFPFPNRIVHSFPSTGKCHSSSRISCRHNGSEYCRESGNHGKTFRH